MGHTGRVDELLEDLGDVIEAVIEDDLRP